MAKKYKTYVIGKPRTKKAKLWKTTTGFIIEINLDKDPELEGVVAYKRKYPHRGMVANIVGVGRARVTKTVKKAYEKSAKKLKVK